MWVDLRVVMPDKDQTEKEFMLYDSTFMNPPARWKAQEEHVSVLSWKNLWRESRSCSKLFLLELSSRQRAETETTSVYGSHKELDCLFTLSS